jgi:hypothetical protein
MPEGTIKVFKFAWGEKICSIVSTYYDVCGGAMPPLKCFFHYGD